MAGKPGRLKIIDQFLADGMTVMFGNPGTVEQGFLDALRDQPAMTYILTLQESVAVLMADGYARASQKPTLVQLHSSPGIGNGAGALYQAKRGHAPLVVIGGDAGLKYMNMDAQMANDLVAMMAPVTKYATLAADSRSLLRTLRRAVKIAATPPMGPVYVCLPMDVLDEPNDEPVFASPIPSTRVLPEPSLLARAAGWLSEAAKPMIFVGDGIAHSGASAELTRVAELLGAEVYGADVGDFNMDTTHPLYRGTFGHMFGSDSLPITRQGDVNLVVGTYMLPEVFPELGDIYAQGSKIIHFDLNAYEIGKNHRVDLGAVCDPKLSLRALADLLDRTMSPERKKAARKRYEEIAEAAKRRIAKEKEDDAKAAGQGRWGMAAFARELARALPEDAIVFDEALTSSPAVTRYLPPKAPGRYFVTRGGSLGVGIPGALGVKLLHPTKTVIGFTGDGASMYTIQALWSAARHGIGAKLVICNNHGYRLLELNIDQYWREWSIPAHDYPEAFSLQTPPIDFVTLAKGMGVDGARVAGPADIGPAIARMLKDDQPFLVDLVVSDT